MAGRRSRHSTQPRTKYCASIPCLHPLRRELDCGSEFVQQPSCRPGLVERTKPHRGPVLSDFRAPPFFSYRTYHSFCIRKIANFSSFGANSRFVSPGRYGTDRLTYRHLPIIFVFGGLHRRTGHDLWLDRKSTRLNSKSLMRIAHAVFCLPNTITPTTNNKRDPE